MDILDILLYGSIACITAAAYLRIFMLGHNIKRDYEQWCRLQLHSKINDLPPFGTR